MTKVLDKRKESESFSNSSITSELIGKFFEEEAHKELRQKDSSHYKRVAEDYMAAAGEYRQAEKSAKNSRKRLGYEKLEERALGQAREAERMAKLYDSTKNYIAPIRWFLRWVHGSNVLGLFLFSILFSNPLISGSITGNFEMNYSIFGILFFFLGIVGCYFLFWKRHIINRFTDQY